MESFYAGGKVKRWRICMWKGGKGGDKLAYGRVEREVEGQTVCRRVRRGIVRPV